MFELKTSKRVTIVVQLGAAWAVGAIALPTVWALLLSAAFAGAPGLLGLVFVGAVGVVAFLSMVITATREVSILGSTGGRRVLWALLVMVGGTVGWALGWAVTDVAGLGVSSSPLLTFLLGGVPFSLAAGVFLRGWQFSTAVLGLNIVLIGASVLVLRQESADDLDAQLAANGVHRETAYVAAIRGYLPAGDQHYGNGLGDGTFNPENPAVVPPDRYITISAHDRIHPGEQMCGQPTAQDSRLMWGSCTVEPNGLVYRHNSIEHGYQVRVGHRYLTVVGTPAVDQHRLRAAALSLHLATVEELGGQQEQTGDYYAAAVPGYTGQVTGVPPGMIYAPADRTGNGSQSVSISLRVTYAASESICFRTIECAQDGPVTYVRTEDTHRYVVQRGEVNVWVQGGLRVDKSLLRQAVMDARPATGEELRRALPPLKPSSFLDRFRQRLRTL